jgi:Transketolase, N-terminal subunit
LEEIRELENKAKEVRRNILQMIYEGNTGHTGGALSSTDIMTVLFYKYMNVDAKNPKKEDRDRFILSKGHCVEPYLYILSDLGFYPKEELKTFSKFGSKFIGHPNNKISGIEMNTGALGHGLSVGVGMAIGAKKQMLSNRVFVLMGDGEQAEGSVWEAAMAGAHYKLNNLIGIVDRNRLQISGSTEEVMGLDPLDKKWEAFGWNVVQINGNSIKELLEVFDKIDEKSDKPTLIIANTTKGCGVSYMENVAKWHHGVPTKEQLDQAILELGGTL